MCFPSSGLDNESQYVEFLSVCPRMPNSNKKASFLSSVFYDLHMVNGYGICIWYFDVSG